ncbi:MAG: hypothetical protein ABIH82_04550 [Candidatus Woesearchaeota archaeon]|nr:hypothetical protein [Nanoarchaeota archaeon]MBU1622697.1 hypothetical protein [Nanoarchaeota archaeon]
MKLKSFLLILVILIVLIISITYTIADHKIPKKTVIIEFDFNVINRGAGFNLDKDKFHFGDIPLGSSATREIQWLNNNSYKEKIRFLIASNVSIGNWFVFDPLSGSVLEPNEKQEFRIDLFIPENIFQQKYEGVIIVQVYKAWPWEKNLRIIPKKVKFSNAYSSDFLELAHIYGKKIQD